MNMDLHDKDTAADAALTDAPHDSGDGGVFFEPAPGAKKARGKKRKIIRFIVIALIVIVVVAIVLQSMALRSGLQVMQSAYIEHTVGRVNISETLSGTGALEPADSYTVTTLIEGDIISAEFEEGDIVAKDAVLYTVDSSDTSSGIERAEITLSQAEMNYRRSLKNRDDLNVEATGTGAVTSIDVEAGDDVTAGTVIATVVDSSVMTIALPFSSFEAVNFYIGQSAAVTTNDSFETLYGTVTKISGVDAILPGGMLTREVTIEVRNPGALPNDQSAVAEIGGALCVDIGRFKYNDSFTVHAGTSGKVQSIFVKEGDRVTNGQTLVRLSSDTLDDDIQRAQNSVRDAEISLENQYDRLDNYTITSPIKGTVVEKSFKEGDTLSAGKALCTIYDLSYLEFTMNIDELDIMKIVVGQDVTVTADAIPGQTFEGAVTKMSVRGTTAGGVTSYPVTVRIDDVTGLLPGMNVNAEILIRNAENVLAVPVSAVSRGNRVFVKADGGQEPPNETPETSGQGEMPARGNTPVRGDIPAGYREMFVETGASDELFVEITSGLKEGDEIIYRTQSADTSLPYMMYGDFSGADFGGPPGGGQYGGGPVNVQRGGATSARPMQ